MKLVQLTACVFLCLIFAQAVLAQNHEPEIHLTIELQAERLKSGDVETRRDAVHRLRLLENAAASRAAVPALRDSAEIVRATAAEAVVFLPTDEAASLLLPLLAEKSEFVRREVAFALGLTHEKSASPDLIRILQTDKQSSVRSASAVALGNIADARAVEPLAQILLAPKTKKNRVIDEFTRRSAARSLGLIRDRRGVPALIAALRDATNSDDVRRESAAALGLIADKSAAAVLQENLSAEDYLLAQIAAAALERIRLSVEIKTVDQ